LHKLGKQLKTPSQFILIVKVLKDKYLSLVIPLGLLIIS
jgi:hypothetical protein